MIEFKSVRGVAEINQDIRLHQDIKLDMCRAFETHVKGDHLSSACEACCQVLAVLVPGGPAISGVSPCSEGRRLTTKFFESRMELEKLESVYSAPSEN